MLSSLNGSDGRRSAGSSGACGADSATPSASIRACAFATSGTTIVHSVSCASARIVQTGAGKKIGEGGNVVDAGEGGVVVAAVQAGFVDEHGADKEQVERVVGDGDRALDAFESPAGLAARKTPWTAKMRSLFQNTRRSMCQLVLPSRRQA